MENKTKHILIAVVVILFAAAIAYQQKTIMKLNSKLSGISAGSLSAGQNASLNNPSTVKAVQSTLTSSTKEITGKITAKIGNSFTMDVEIVDLSKLASTKEEYLTGDTASLPKTKKTYNVSVNDQTQYPSRSFQDLSVGDQAVIKTNELVYQADILTASEIMIIGKGDIPFAEIMKEMKYIAGQVKETNDKYLVVEVIQMDTSKVSDPKTADPKTVPKITKNYKIFIDSKTSFAGSQDAIKVGNVIKAYSDKPVFPVTEFTATKIEGPIQLPAPAKPAG